MMSGPGISLSVRTPVTGLFPVFAILVLSW